MCENTQIPSQQDIYSFIDSLVEELYDNTIKWKDKNSKYWAPHEMSNKHLTNVIRYLETHRHNDDPLLSALTKELNYRIINRINK